MPESNKEEIVAAFQKLSDFCLGDFAKNAGGNTPTCLSLPDYTSASEKGNDVYLKFETARAGHPYDVVLEKVVENMATHLRTAGVKYDIFSSEPTDVSAKMPALVVKLPNYKNSATRLSWALAYAVRESAAREILNALKKAEVITSLLPADARDYSLKSAKNDAVNAFRPDWQRQDYEASLPPEPGTQW
jgi:hypothetical protein